MKRFPLLVIVIAQFLGTSLWFSANGVADRLAQDWGITTAGLGYLTSAVQLGFIVGTLLLAISGLADRYPASRIFFTSALLGAIANTGFGVFATSIQSGVPFRFVTGLALAGIYPLGMKLVITWAPEKKGMVLGWLVGMLVLGTAFPHLVRGLGTDLGWQSVVGVSSVLALLAGVAVLWMGDGPYHSTVGRMNWGGLFRTFRSPVFRGAAWGYFGHMWELYAVWTLAPLLIAPLVSRAHWPHQSIALLAFLFIAVGGIGCVFGGYLSRHFDSARVAAVALATSGTVCAVYPWLGELPVWLLGGVLVVWGVTVAADSPQFSALAAAGVPGESLGSALAIMNSIGFLITILAIQLTTTLWASIGSDVIWLLVPGPLLGLWGMRRLPRQYRSLVSQ